MLTRMLLSPNKRFKFPNECFVIKQTVLYPDRLLLTMAEFITTGFYKVQLGLSNNLSYHFSLKINFQLFL